MDDFPLRLRRVDVFGGWAMAFFTSNIEFDIFGFISSVNLLQFEAGIMATRTAHIKGFLHGRLSETPVHIIPILKIIRNPARGRLVPLEWEDVVPISNLDFVALFPAPSPKGP